MRSTKRFVPAVAELERRCLLAIIPTNLAVHSGWVPSGDGKAGTGQGVSAFPIALSTASWHLYGHATQNNPENATAATTIDPNNWTVVLDAGTGPVPANPGQTNGSWAANGDNVTKYLLWGTNTPILMADFDVEAEGEAIGKGVDLGRHTLAGIRSSAPMSTAREARSRNGIELADLAVERLYALPPDPSDNPLESLIRLRGHSVRPRPLM